MFPRLLKQVPHPGSTNPNNHLYKFRSAHREKRYASFPRHCPGKERFTRSRRPNQQHPFKSCAAKFGVFNGVLKEVDKLHQFVCCLINARHVHKTYPLIRRLIKAYSLTFAHAHHGATHAASGSSAEEPDIETDNQDSRAKPDQEAEEGIDFLLKRSS